MYEILNKKVKKVGKYCLYGGEVFYFYFMINWDY